ncbi:MAG TPA: hypothetical protein VFQ53_05870 [Kofleriaceae bacterium]|nr:hypothetical protein [Kofleriaceae bacterium]
MARRRSKRPAVLATSLLACSAPAAPRTTPPPDPAASAPTDPATRAIQALAGDALPPDRYARRTLYTWTTAEQIEALRAGGPLLVRAESPTNGASFLAQLLYTLAHERRDPMARVLATTTFAKMRFAWHAPWATRAGWPGEQYGDQLIRVTLRPEAIVVALDAATGTFDARDLANHPVPIAAVLGAPERIAAIYFVAIRARSGDGLPRAPATYREFALCNEAMIESWEVGTPAIDQALARDRATLDAVIAFAEHQPGARRMALQAWTGAPVNDPTMAYSAALALASPLYWLDRDRLVQLRAQLAATPRPAPFTGTSRIAFPGPGKQLGAPRVVPRPLETYAATVAPTSAR